MNYLLFTTTTCPKCPAIKEYIESNLDFPGQMINEDSAKFHQLAEEHQVMKVPTLIIFNTEGKEIFRAHDGSEVAEFITT